MNTRRIEKVVEGRATRDGAGVKLKRVIGGRELPDLDPFLLLDEFKSDRGDDYAGGFPDHPHRGFETVTYMLAGRMEHHDHQGNRGLLGPGSVQWMTAGRGIIHSEMPRQVDGLLWGFQLWVNLPARDKMMAPRYQDIAAERIPVVSPSPGATIRVVAGTAAGATGPVTGIVTNPVYLDVALEPGAAFPQELPSGHHGFLYGVEGRVRVADTDLTAGHLGVLSDGDTVELASGASGGRVLLVAARPLKEPVARYGPFVMNTRAQIEEAVRQYQDGSFLSS